MAGRRGHERSEAGRGQINILRAAVELRGKPRGGRPGLAGAASAAELGLRLAVNRGQEQLTNWQTDRQVEGQHRILLKIILVSDWMY